MQRFVQLFMGYQTVDTMVFLEQLVDDVWHDDDNRAAETAIQEKINIEFSDIYDI